MADETYRISIAVPTAGTVPMAFTYSLSGLIGFTAAQGIPSMPGAEVDLQINVVESSNWITNREQLVRRALDKEMAISMARPPCWALWRSGTTGGRPAAGRARSRSPPSAAGRRGGEEATARRQSVEESRRGREQELMVVRQTLRDLGKDTVYTNGQPISPSIETPNQPDCDPLFDWQFALGTGYTGKTPATDYLYFVARGDGSSEFSRTLEEHNRAVAQYIRKRNP
mgnify:CR=1 FL=1